MAKPKIVCGGQYAGRPYLKCNAQDGREAIPEVCTRYYRNCNGIQVHLSTVCVSPERGSAEHVALYSACKALGALMVAPPADPDADQHPVPDGLDVKLL